MIILALDTTTDLASVALRRDGKTLAEQSVVTSDGHSYLLFQMIQAVLDEAGVTVADVDCFASALGPGSFTGVRICLAAAKGLADATRKRAFGISNLKALATFGTAKMRNPVIDARRGQIYTAVYDQDLRLASEEVVVARETWDTPANMERIEIRPPLAAAIALCAEMDGASEWKDAAILDAHYVRSVDGEGFWEDRGGMAVPAIPRIP